MSAVNIVCLVYAALLFIGLRNERVFNCRMQIIDAFSANHDHPKYDEYWKKYQSKSYYQCMWEFNHWTAEDFFPEIKEL
jgi:hypothetical protein